MQSPTALHFKFCAHTSISPPPVSNPPVPVVLVHGGAWAIPQYLSQASIQGVQQAAQTGLRVLIQKLNQYNETQSDQKTIEIPAFDASKSSSGNDTGGVPQSMIVLSPSTLALLDAVEAAVNILEDHPAFDAGRGSCLNTEGKVEMDAFIMAGSHGYATTTSTHTGIHTQHIDPGTAEIMTTDSVQVGSSVHDTPDRTTTASVRHLPTGAVASITNVKNPVSVARKVLECTPHCLLVGDGATQFARECGFPYVPDEDLVSDHAKDEKLHYDLYRHAVQDLFNSAPSTRADGLPFHRPPQEPSPPPTLFACPPPPPPRADTVGAVAFDGRGHFAAATSTGGITAKRVGRVGDSPLVGAGGLCDDQIGAISTTGHGESIMKVSLAARAAWEYERMMENEDKDKDKDKDKNKDKHRSGENNHPDDHDTMMKAQVSVERALHYMWKKTAGRGGMIMIGKDGRVGVSFTTERMAWAMADATGRAWSGIDHAMHLK